MRLTVPVFAAALLVSALPSSAFGQNGHQRLKRAVIQQRASSSHTSSSSTWGLGHGGGSDGHSGHSGTPSPVSSTGSHGPAWHEHPIWDHPALKEGAKFWPSSSSSDHAGHRPHSPTHSTGSKPPSVKGKEVAGPSHPVIGHKPPHEHPAGSRPFTLDQHGNLKYPAGPAGGPKRGPGRPKGSKDKAPRKPYERKKKKKD